MLRRAILCSKRSLTRISTAKSYQITKMPIHHHHHPPPSFSRSAPINPYFHTHQNPILQYFPYSSSTPHHEKDTEERPVSNGSGFEEMKHQEIEGPTVERDNSAVAEETREVTLSLMKTMYKSSNLLALLGLSQLALGAWLTYSISGSGSGLDGVSVKVMSAVGFGFPICLAFLIRRAVKTMHFFNKMEKLERLHILTSSMQMLKQLQLLFLRIRPVSFLCFSSLSISLLYSLLSSLPSS